MNFEQDIDQIVRQVSDAEACIGNIVRIGASCIAEINERFFLLVEIEIGKTEQVLIIRISEARAEALLRAGVRRCRIVNTIPTSAPGREVNLICAFVEGGNAFLVFNVETNNKDVLVLVRVPLCTVIG